MPVVFKQNFNSFNLEFDNYLEVLFQVNEAGFCSELQLFGRELFGYVVEVRAAHSALRDLSEEVLSRATHGAVLVAGRLVLLTARVLQDSIEDRLNDDFPKFIGTKTNYWRYLLRFIPFYMNEVYYDYTKQFAVATACLLELNFYCLQVGQHHLVENFRMFWLAMFLHFFGERFKGRDKCAFLKDLNLNRKELDVFVKEVKPKTEEEDKKSHKKNKKRHK